MQTRKTIIAAALVWMAGLLGIILFQDVFAGSLLGAVLGILMVIVTLAATYFMVDGMLMLKQQSEEQQDLLQRAYQDKLLELMSQEMERLNDKKRRTCHYRRCFFRTVQRIHQQNYVAGRQTYCEI